MHAQAQCWKGSSSHKNSCAAECIAILQLYNLGKQYNIVAIEVERAGYVLCRALVHEGTVSTNEEQSLVGYRKSRIFRC